MLLKEIKHPRLRIMRIGIYLFDIVSWIIYFLATNILRSMLTLFETIALMMIIAVFGILMRNQLCIKPYNNTVNLINLEKENKI